MIRLPVDSDTLPAVWVRVPSVNAAPAAPIETLPPERFNVPAVLELVVTVAVPTLRKAMSVDPGAVPVAPSVPPLSRFQLVPVLQGVGPVAFHVYVFAIADPRGQNVIALRQQFRSQTHEKRKSNVNVVKS